MEHSSSERACKQDDLETWYALYGDPGAQPAQVQPPKNRVDEPAPKEPLFPNTPDWVVSIIFGAVLLAGIGVVYLGKFTNGGSW